MSGAHGPRVSPERRRELADAFKSSAVEYDAIRPGYPELIVDACIAGLTPRDGLLTAADIGAGTGIFSAQLMQAAERIGVGLEVTAVDVSEAMLARARERGLPTLRASGEDTGIPGQSLELVTYAQAWHWVDAEDAGREAARLVRPKGRLALVWNQLDVTVPWVHRLSRIMRSGDVFYDPARPPRPGGRWRSPELITACFDQSLTPREAVDLAKSRSSYRRAPTDQQERIERQTLWYLCDELGYDPDVPFALPYISFVWSFVRSSRVDS